MPRLRYLFSRFLWIGAVGFGGPVAVMAVIKREVSDQSRWLEPTRFQELLALSKLLPGPQATQLVIGVGKDVGGVRGGVVSGVAFVLPAFLCMLVLAPLALSGISVAASQGLFGLQLGALAVIVESVFGLAKPYTWRPLRRWVLLALGMAIMLRRPDLEPWVILAVGLAGVAYQRYAVRPRELASIFWVCFKAGVLLFGSGLAIIPLLEPEVVEKRHWLTHAEFMLGVSLGQITPGPVMISCVFIGYKVAGFPGAFAAMTGAFLPSFINVLVWLPWVFNSARAKEGLRVFSIWALPVIIGAMVATTVRIGAFLLQGSNVGWITGKAALLVAGIVALAFQVPTVAVIFGSGLIWWLSSWFLNGMV